MGPDVMEPGLIGREPRSAVEPARHRTGIQALRPMPPRTIPRSVKLRLGMSGLVGATLRPTFPSDQKADRYDKHGHGSGALAAGQRPIANRTGRGRLFQLVRAHGT